MTERVLTSGTRLYFGAPANPMPAIMADAIGQVVAQVPGIREAYLPQCYIQGDTNARQILVVGIAKPSQIPPVMENLMEKMRLVMPEGEFIDIIPFSVSSMPAEARVVECMIFKVDTPAPWWKFWGKD